MWIVCTLLSHLHKLQCHSGSSLHSAVFFLNKPLFGLASVGREYLRNQGRKFCGKQRKGKETMSDSRLDLHCFCLQREQSSTWRHHNWPSWRLGADRWRKTRGWRMLNTKWKSQSGRLSVVFMYFRWRWFAFSKKNTGGTRNGAPSKNRPGTLCSSSIWCKWPQYSGSHRAHYTTEIFL